MKKVVLFLLITYFFLILPETHGATPAKRRYYSIQIIALPLSQKKDGFIIYKKLKEKGYLVYYYKIKIEDIWWMRLKVGVFLSISDAQAFGKKFNEKEGFDFIVTRADISINAFKTEYEIITTPSAIWMRAGSINKEIFLFSKSKVGATDVLAYTRPVISLDGKEIIFSHDSKVKTINIKGKKIDDKMGNGAETFAVINSSRITTDVLDRAISDFSKVIKTNPRNAAAYYNRGNVYQRKGNDDKAIADYNKAIEINPRLAEAYNNRAVAYRRKGLYDNAIDDYSKAIALDLNDAEAYNNRGITYSIGKANYEQAILDFSRAIEIDPKYAKAYYNRGFVYFLKKEYDNAWNDVKKAQTLGYKIQPEFVKMLREATDREK